MREERPGWTTVDLGNGRMESSFNPRWQEEAIKATIMADLKAREPDFGLDEIEQAERIISGYTQGY